MQTAPIIELTTKTTTPNTPALFGLVKKIMPKNDAQAKIIAIINPIIVELYQNF
ncbi:MAG: hypothetical protein UV45_C0006G0004 [Candidatus Azambacteria bacterium GW2011_GWB1_42_72]|nr:MAG: hypothetical protein UV45_C0006G0004 [Candidatus Azambacteria bacterium GW2011_GWB1_42_72]